MSTKKSNSKPCVNQIYPCFREVFKYYCIPYRIVLINYLLLTDEEDWKEFIYCNTDRECIIQSPDGTDSFCSEVDNVYDNNGSSVKGVCVPSQCTDDVACPPVGDTCTSGTIYGACTNGQCLYDPIRLIAECFLPE